MTLDEEIFLAKEEKKLLTSVNALLEGINFEGTNQYDVKYSKNAELLREYKYFDKISELAKTKDYDYSRLVSMRENVKLALDKVNSEDQTGLKNAYSILAEAYSFLEASSAEKRAFRNSGKI